MSSYKTDQRHVLHRGRKFHFVTYEGHIANPARDVAASPPTWFLMSAGKRWAVMPQSNGDPADDVEAQLIRWLEENVFNLPPEAPRGAPSPTRGRTPQPELDAAARKVGSARRHYR